VIATDVRRWLVPVALAAALMLAAGACARPAPATPTPDAAPAPDAPREAGEAEAGEAEAAEAEEVQIGYGTQRREHTTGAVSSVDMESASRQYATRIDELLQGRVAGVRVFRTATGVSVRIRGTNSFYGSSEPLYVIDGTPVVISPDGTLPVAAGDVARIDVLKDAGSTAIYGSRGANGVILIRTKRAH
jgi:TonB-dependent SusC/RagA subfamily outer membrane receptor